MDHKPKISIDPFSFPSAAFLPLTHSNTRCARKHTKTMDKVVQPPSNNSVTVVALARKLSCFAESLTLALDRIPNDRGLDVDETVTPLTIKNELKLSHLQNLALILVIKIRGIMSRYIAPNAPWARLLHEAVVKSLMAIRIYFEKGIRRLESRLKLQIVALIDQNKETFLGSDWKVKLPAHDQNGGDNKFAHSKMAKFSRQPSTSSLGAPRRPPKNALSNAPPGYMTRSSFDPSATQQESPDSDHEPLTLEDLQKEVFGDTSGLDLDADAETEISKNPVASNAKMTGYMSGSLSSHGSISSHGKKGQRKRAVNFSPQGNLRNGVVLAGGSKRLRT